MALRGSGRGMERGAGPWALGADGTCWIGEEKGIIGATLSDSDVGEG